MLLIVMSLAEVARPSLELDYAPEAVFWAGANLEILYRDASRQHGLNCDLGRSCTKSAIVTPRDRQ